MKGLVTLLVISLILVWAGYYFMGNEMSREEQMVAFACGNSKGDVQEIQVVVPIAFPKREPPRMSENNVLLWDEWVEEHWIIISTDGERVPLRRKFAANLIPEAKVGSPDCYLIGQVRTGVEYTFDFIPSLAEQKRFRRMFKVDPAGVPFGRLRFEMVQGS